MPLASSYFPTYFSIDDILATQERTSCKFLQEVPKLGSLNPSLDGGDLPSGTELELPMWMAVDFASGRQPLISAEYPKAYQENYREILKADPNAVDLHKVGLHFYELGQYVKQWDPRGDVSDLLIDTFRLRFRNIMDMANNEITDPVAIQKLDTLEQSLYNCGHCAKEKLSSWLMFSNIALEAASMVVNHKKRKRIVEEIQ